MPQQTVEQIRKLRFNALIGKKKHFNAAERKGQYHTRTALAVVLLNVILGSAFFLYIKEIVPDGIKWAGAAISLGAAALMGLQSHFSWPRMVQGHRTVAAHYLELTKRCSNLLAQHADGIVTNAQLGSQLDKLTKEQARIDESANAYPTNRADYQQAKQGLSEGEEQYTEQELAAGD